MLSLGSRGHHRRFALCSAATSYQFLWRLESFLARKLLEGRGNMGSTLLFLALEYYSIISNVSVNHKGGWEEISINSVNLNTTMLILNPPL
jgi:hypothetical protein